MVTKKTFDASNVEPQQPAPSDFETEFLKGAEAPEVVVAPAPSGGAGDKKQFDELAFNEQFVEVMVHESTDEKAENPVFTACNGVTQYFLRGETQKVRRKYVAILASCKEHSIKTVEYTQPDGARAMRIERSSSLKYPFSVIYDPAGKKGADWLRSLLQAPT
jgi:hypothetical protein